MTDVAAIRTALAALAETAAITVNSTSVPIRSYDDVPTTVDPGSGVAVLISPGAPFLTPVTLDGADDVSLNAVVVTSRSSERSAQARLDAAAIALRDVFTSDHTTNWDFVEPGNPTAYGDYTFGSGDNALSFYGFTMALQVATS